MINALTRTANYSTDQFNVATAVKLNLPANITQEIARHEAEDRRDRTPINDELIYAGQYANKRITRNIAVATNVYDLPDLHFAASTGNTELAEKSLASSVNIEQKFQRFPYVGMTPLLVAVTEGHNPLIALLLRYGANPEAVDGNGRTVLMAALNFERTDIAGIKMLLGKIVRLNTQDFDGNTALMYAARLCRFDMFITIVAKGADRKMLNHQGRSVFMVAACAGNTELVAYLLRNGVDINQTDSNNWTALQYAQSLNNRPMIALLQAHQSTTVTNATGTPRAAAPATVPTSPPIKEDISVRWWRAVQTANLYLMDILLTVGIDINIRDRQGRTALILAAQSGTLAAVVELRRRGALLDLTDNDGKTALFYARLLGHTQLAAVLQPPAAHSGASSMMALFPPRITLPEWGHLCRRVYQQTGRLLSHYLTLNPLHFFHKK
ncbi:ankyrin repeat domain-containing protein [Sodalis sp. RH21]|uniref:ankyrin repeat domain-containing protein n=1 Tax=unclassified Sodalis (in: enterobacteria) TaxID=2636512 RepID=UPI0039B5C33A